VILYRAGGGRKTANVLPTAPDSTSGLSDATKAILTGMSGRIAVDYYSVLDLPEVTPATRAFAERVNDLLAEYERVAAGKLKVARHQLRADAPKASQKGLRPFGEFRDAGYLGIVLARNGKQEVLPRLGPEWEQALEPDLTRAIQRLLESPATAPPTDEAAAGDELLAKAKASVPNLETASLEEGKRLLREMALAEFKAATQEGQARVKEAQERVLQAQTSGSEDARQEALNNLQRVQAAQTERLTDIAARSDARIAAFERLKK
jgi:hypothetical protein